MVIIPFENIPPKEKGKLQFTKSNKRCKECKEKMIGYNYNRIYCDKCLK